MTLKQTIDDYKKQMADKVPPEAAEVMHRATEELQATIPNRKIPSVGDPLLPFSLPNSKGDMVSSATLRQSGPLVITFFRGMW